MKIEDLSFEQVKELLELSAKARTADVQSDAAPDRTKAVNVVTETDRAKIASVNVNTMGDESPYKKAFDKWMRHDGGSLDHVEKATLVEGTGANGGYAVPAEYAQELVVPLRDASWLRNPAIGVTIDDVDGTNAYHLPAQTDSAAAALTSEAGGYTQSEPTLADTTFTPYKYTKLSKVSEELLADSRFDPWNMILQPDYVQAFAAAENGSFTTGTGSSQPEGFTTNATVGVTLANSTSQVSTIASFDRLIDLYYSVDYKYRSNGVWLMNDAVVQIIRQFKDSTGRYLVNMDNGLQPGSVGEIMGRPIFIDNSMATPAANAKTIAFGTFSFFRIADFSKGQMFVQRLNELYAGTGQIGFRATFRTDGLLTLSEAVQLMVMHA